MKQTTKIALAVAAGAAALLLKKKQPVSGVGAVLWDYALMECKQKGIDLDKDYFAQSWDVLDEIGAMAKKFGYRMSASSAAMGRTNRQAFYYALQRHAEKMGLISHLVPNDSHKSFYGKAVLDDQGDYIILYSYDTPVVQYDKSAGIFYIMPNGEFAPDGKYSATTTRHIRAFAAQLGINVGNARVGAYS